MSNDFDRACVGIQPNFSSRSNRGETVGKYPAPVIGRGVIIRPYALVYAGCVLGERTFVGDTAIVREMTMVGPDVVIGAGAIIENNCLIGKGTKIMTGAYICAYSEIGENCFVGPRVVTTNDRYMGHSSIPPERRRAERKGLVMLDGSHLGAGVTTLPGVVIGSDVVVGAGGVVTRDLLEPGVYVCRASAVLWERRYL